MSCTKKYLSSDVSKEKDSLSIFDSSLYKQSRPPSFLHVTLVSGTSVQTPFGMLHPELPDLWHRTVDTLLVTLCREVLCVMVVSQCVRYHPALHYFHLITSKVVRGWTLVRLQRVEQLESTFTLRSPVHQEESLQENVLTREDLCFVSYRRPLSFFSEWILICNLCSQLTFSKHSFIDSPWVLVSSYPLVPWLKNKKN